MSNRMKWWQRLVMPGQEARRPWILRTQPPVDGSRDKSPVGYIRRDHTLAWCTADPVLADREVAYDLDTDTFTVGDGEMPYTGLPRYARRVADVLMAEFGLR